VQVFDVQHQWRAHGVLQRALASDRFPHGYLFDGPPGVGKEMMALRLAGLLLCPNVRQVEPPDGAGVAEAGITWRDACWQCRHCELIAAGTHPDVHSVSRQLHQHHPDPQVRQRRGLELSVEVIRHFLIEPAYVRPAVGAAKVFIVQEADRMSHAAQNALLKTLEEPPVGTFLILLVERPEQLLPTILSRCQQVPFALLPREFVEQELVRQRSLQAEAARFLAALSEGRMGLALEYADDGLFERKRQLLSTWVQQEELPEADLVEQLEQTAEALAEQYRQRSDVGPVEASRRGLRTVLSVLASVYRDALLRATGSHQAIINGDQPEVVRALAERWADQAAAVVDLIAKAEQQVEQNVNANLVLESLVIHSSSVRRRGTAARAATR
jgi:DNA polymerase-3 subunit delta'